MQKIDHTQRAPCEAHLEEEPHDSLDIKLLRFSAVFTYLYLSLLLVAGIYDLHDFSGTDSNTTNSILSILVGVLGLTEVATLLWFLIELKKKV